MQTALELPTTQLTLALLDDDTAWLNAYQQLLRPLPQVAVIQPFSAPTDLYNWLRLGHRADRYILDFDLQAEQTGVEVAYTLHQNYQALTQAIVISSATLPELIGKHPYAFCPKNQVAQWLTHWVSTPLDNQPNPHMA